MSEKSEVSCGSCKEKIDLVKDKVIICKGKCNKAFHKRCSRVTEIVYVGYLTDKNKFWLCNMCDEKTASTIRSKRPSPSISSPNCASSPLVGKDSQTNLSADRVSEILDKLNTVILQNKSLEQELSVVRSEFKETFSNMAAEMSKLSRENENLKQQVEAMNFRLNITDQQRLAGHVEISGVQSRPGENLQEVILKIADKVGSNLVQQNIQTVFRKKVDKNKNNKGNTYPIVAVLNDLRIKEDFIKKYRSIQRLNTSILDDNNIEVRPLYVSHRLTKTSQFLLFKAKEKRTQGLIKYVWIREGNV